MDGRVGIRRAVRMALAAGAGIGLGTTGSVWGQDDVAVQQKITVTGSRIKRVDLEGPQPVTRKVRASIAPTVESVRFIFSFPLPSAFR